MSVKENSKSIEFQRVLKIGKSLEKLLKIPNTHFLIPKFKKLWEKTVVPGSL